jgi:(S)-ureidoglycine aminohydrolase
VNVLPDDPAPGASVARGARGAPGARGGRGGRADGPSARSTGSFDTRGSVKRGFHLITGPNRALSVLGELGGATVCKLVTPRRAPARFAEYLVELEPGGGTAGRATRPGFEHFLYCLGGVARTVIDGDPVALASGDFAYIADDHPFELDNQSPEPAQVLWVKRRYEPLPGWGRPPSRAGRREDVAENEYIPGLWRRELIAAGDPRHDFSMILMRFAPGGDLGMVEIHDEEHGLYMTAGGGIYLLDRDEHRVEQGDFIYMAPYCPQGFVAGGTDGAEYLLYKDVYRDGF